jgi:hypothetical protein
VASLKWHFFTDEPVVHPALADRPPLYPLWAAAWVALSPQPDEQIYLARLGNLLLAAAVPLLIFWSLRAAVLDVAAAWAALIFTLYPAFLRNAAQLLTEPLFLVLLFGSLGLFLRARSSRHMVLSGLLAGLAFLTRPTGLLLPILYAFLIVSGVQKPRPTPPERLNARPGTHEAGGARPNARWSLLLLLGGFLLPIVPYWIGVAAQTGSPFTSVLRYNYSIRNIQEGTFYGFERRFLPPGAFMQAHAGELLHLIARQWRTMGLALWRSLQFLVPLILFWRPRPSWCRTALIGLALLNFLFHAMSWTVWGAARYLFPTYIIGLALLLEAPFLWEMQAAPPRTDTSPWAMLDTPLSRLTGPIGRIGRRHFVNAVVGLAVGLTLAACLQQDVWLYREKMRPEAGIPLGWAYRAAADRLAQTPPGSLCAANQPWIVNLLARRPAVMAPRFRDEEQLRRYLAHYRPATLTLFVTERDPEDVATARRLVQDLWSSPRVWPELSKLLVLERAELRAGQTPRQALLMFRIGVM